MQGDDPLTTLLPGAELLSATLLADGIHPGDEGHRKIARLIGLEVGALMLRNTATTADIQEYSS